MTRTNTIATCTLRRVVTLVLPSIFHTGFWIYAPLDILLCSLVKLAKRLLLIRARIWSLLTLVIAEAVQQIATNVRIGLHLEKFLQ